MPTPAFPTLPSGKKPDSSKYEVSKSDPAMRSEAEGGYTITRARHTRAPTRKFKMVYTFLDTADRKVLDDFYDLVRGGSVIFTWEDPYETVPVPDGSPPEDVPMPKVWNVRFGSGGMPFTYTGIGGNHKWDCSFTLEQA